MNRKSLPLSFVFSALFVGAMTVAFMPITSYSSTDSSEGCTTFYFSDSPTWVGGVVRSTITDTSGNWIGEVVCFPATTIYPASTICPATTITTMTGQTSTTTTTSMVTETSSVVPTWTYGVMFALLIVGLAIGYVVKRPPSKP